MEVSWGRHGTRARNARLRAAPHTSAAVRAGAQTRVRRAASVDPYAWNTTATSATSRRPNARVAGALFPTMTSPWRGISRSELREGALPARSPGAGGASRCCRRRKSPRSAGTPKAGVRISLQKVPPGTDRQRRGHDAQCCLPLSHSLPPWCSGSTLKAAFGRLLSFCDADRREAEE